MVEDLSFASFFVDRLEELRVYSAEGGRKALVRLGRRYWGEIGFGVWKTIQGTAMRVGV